MHIKWQPKTKIEKDGLKAVRILGKAGFQAFWVGGAVRDILLKRESDNLDIATDATPDSVERIFEKDGIKTKPVGKKYGSILAIVSKNPIEITTFRSEGRYSDKRHPDEIRFIKDYLNDAKRRDFTINALYFNPLKKELFDPTSGIKDLGLKILRFVGNPRKRIDEDALRMLRGVRLSTQLGFKLEKNSFAAIKTRAKYIQDVSGERIKAELDKILLSDNRVPGLRLLDEIGLLKFIIPETIPLKKFSHGSKIFHLEGNMWNHTLMVLSQLERFDLDLVYALIFHDIGKPRMARRILLDNEWITGSKGHQKVSEEIFSEFAKRLKFPRQSAELIKWLILNHEIRGFMKASREGQIFMALDSRFELLLEIWKSDIFGAIRDRTRDTLGLKMEQALKFARALNYKVKKKQTLISRLAKGSTVIKYFKIPSGPRIGELINKMKVQIVLGKIKNEKDLKKFAKWA